jgi:hypothetical protein
VAVRRVIATKEEEACGFDAISRPSSSSSSSSSSAYKFFPMYAITTL